MRSLISTISILMFAVNSSLIAVAAVDAAENEENVKETRVENAQMDEESDDGDEATTNSISRYQPIIDRMPFGALPPGFDPNAPMAKDRNSKSDRQMEAEEKRLKGALRMCAFNVTPEGKTFVGFVDGSSKPEKTYYMAVGETNESWIVVSADFEKREATLSKGGIEVTLMLGGGVSNGGGNAAANIGGKQGAVAAVNDSVASSRPRSLLGMRRHQREEEARQEEAKRLAAEQLKAEKEAAAEAERIKKEEEYARQEAERQADREALNNVRQELLRLKENRETSSQPQTNEN